MIAPTFDSTHSNNAGSGTTVSVNHTCDGLHRIAFIKLDVISAITSLTITYGGAACTLVDSFVPTAGYTTYIYKFLNPPTASSAVTASWTGASSSEITVLTFKDVNQVIPYGTVAKATGSSTTISVNVASAVGELVQDFETSGGNPTQGAGQTPDFGYSAIVNNNGSYKTGAAGNVTMSWTQANSFWGTLGLSLKPFGGVLAMGMY